MNEYIKGSIKIIEVKYLPPFGVWIEILRLGRGFLSKPQYWWLFAFQTNSTSSHLTISFLGLTFDWRRKDVI